MFKFLNQFKICLLDYQYWLHFGLLNIKIKYRNSIIGPFWNTISLTILILAISFGYASYLVKDNLVNYVYYVSISLITWQLVANCLNESTVLLENKKNLILENDLIDKIFIYEILLTNIIIYLHGLFLIFVIGIIANVQVNIYFLLSLFGFFLILINLIFLMNLIMILSVIFTDIKKIFENLIVIAFFSTPIIWKEELLNSKLNFLLNFNPCYHLLNVFRQPLLNKIDKQYFISLIISFLITIIIIIFSYYIDRKYKKYVKLYL